MSAWREAVAAGHEVMLVWVEEVYGEGDVSLLGKILLPKTPVLGHLYYETALRDLEDYEWAVSAWPTGRRLYWFAGHVEVGSDRIELAALRSLLKHGVGGEHPHEWDLVLVGEFHPQGVGE